MAASAPQNSALPGLRTISTAPTTEATRANATSTGVCQPASRARKLNAAPLLKTRTILKNGVACSASPGAKRARIAHFTSWSASTMAAATPNQRAALDMPTGLAGTTQVAHATAAQALFVHVRPVVPAALAFCMLGRLHGRLQFARTNRPRGGGDQHVLQLLSEARQRFVVLAGRADLHLGLQRSADLSGAAQVLDAFAHRIAQCAQPAPFRQQSLSISRPRHFVEGLEENAIGCAAELLPGLVGGEGEHRRHEAHQTVRDVPQRGLRRAARCRIGAARVKTVLQDI